MAGSLQYLIPYIIRLENCDGHLQASNLVNSAYASVCTCACARARVRAHAHVCLCE